MDEPALPGTWLGDLPLLDIVRTALAERRRATVHPADQRTLNDEAQRVTRAIQMAYPFVKPGPGPVAAPYE